MRLIHGEALEELKKMPERSVDMIFTDPPYGHNNNNGDLIHNIEIALGRTKILHPARKIANDGIEANVLFQQFLFEAKRVLRIPGCCCCCCCCCCGGGGGPDPQFSRWSMMMNEVFEFVQMIIWDKGPMGLGWRYRRSYETILVAKQPGKMRWYDDSKCVENIIRPGNGISKIIPSADQHPTEKPWSLAAFFIRLHTQPGDVVLDPFAGSGSTGEACQKLGRDFIGIELDEHWFRQAQLRLSSVPLPFGVRT